MATRKKAAKKRSAKRASAFGIELPTTLREFANELRKRLDRLERDAARAQLEARRRAARLLREASQQLGRLEVGGEAAWRKLGASYQKELVALLGRLEKALAPARPKRKSGARKKPASPAATTSETSAAAD